MQITDAIKSAVQTTQAAVARAADPFGSGTTDMDPTTIPFVPPWAQPSPSPLGPGGPGSATEAFEWGEMEDMIVGPGGLIPEDPYGGGTPIVPVPSSSGGGAFGDAFGGGAFDWVL